MAGADGTTRTRPGSSWERRIWACALMCLLLVPTALAGLGFVPNDVRVETVAEPARFEAGRTFDADQYRAIDQQLEDRFPGRGLGLWAEAQVDYEIFGDVTNPELTKGPGDWLHRAASLDPACSALVGIGERPLAAELIDRVVFVPLAPKSQVHPEGAFVDDVAPCVSVERAGWIDRTQRAPGYLDVTAGLMEAAARSDDLLFYEQDSHWTQSGRLLVAEQIIERLAPGLWEQADIIDVAPTVRDMDLLRLLGVKRDGTLVDRAVVLGGDVTVDRVSAVESMSTHFPLVQISRSTAPDRIPGTTMVVGDSQFGYLIAELEPFFEELVFVNWLQQIVDPSKLEDLPVPDRVVFSGVEANAAQLFSSPFVDATIAQLER